MKQWGMALLILAWSGLGNPTIADEVMDVDAFNFVGCKYLHFPVGKTIHDGDLFARWIPQGYVREIQVAWDDQLGSKTNAWAVVRLDHVILGTRDIKKEGNLSRFNVGYYARGDFRIRIREDDARIHFFRVLYCR